MARKRPALQQKVRTEEHVLAELAVNHVERQVQLCRHSVERIIHDYGLDLILFTYNTGGELEDGSVFLQVKGTKQARALRNGQAIPFRVARADVLTWARRAMPVILIVYDASADRAYWAYIQRYFESLPGFNLFTLRETVTIRVPTGQVLDPGAIRQFAAFRDQVLAQTAGSIRHV